MLFMLAMTSALAVSGVFVARQLLVDVAARKRGAEVEPAAERGLVDAIAQWDTTRRPLQSVGATEPLDASQNVAVWATRLSETSYWLVAESRGGTRPALRHRLGVLVRITNRVAAPVANRGWTPLP
jgi:hypothetical protein